MVVVNTANNAYPNPQIAAVLFSTQPMAGRMTQRPIEPAKTTAIKVKMKV